MALLPVALLSTVAEAGWTTFSYINSPIGVACVGDGAGGITDTLVVTSYYQGGGFYTVDESGMATWRSVFGLPNWWGVEVYNAVSPGLGNWPTGLVYLVKGNEVYELSADLSTATLIASIHGSAGTHSGITFDRTGKWNYDMIITHQGGAVYRISRSSGGIYTWSYVANTYTMQESPRIINDDPAKWGTYAASITTSSENTYQVFAICQNSIGGYSVSTLATNVSQR